MKHGQRRLRISEGWREQMNWAMRWMYGVQLKDGVKIEELWKRLEMEVVSDVVRRGKIEVVCACGT